MKNDLWLISLLLRNTFGDWINASGRSWVRNLLWAGGWTRWSLEDPSNPFQTSVVLWFAEQWKDPSNCMVITARKIKGKFRINCTSNEEGIKKLTSYFWNLTNNIMLKVYMWNFLKFFYWVFFGGLFNLIIIKKRSNGEKQTHSYDFV